MTSDVSPSAARPNARFALGGLAVGPISVAGVALVGWIGVHTAGSRVNGHDLALAAAICLISYLVGLLPMLLGGRAGHDPVRQFQFAWAGTLLHLAIAAALGIATILLTRPGNGFVCWLLGMFWGTLAGLCAVTIRHLRTRGVCLSNTPPVAPAGTSTVGGGAATIETA